MLIQPRACLLLVILAPPLLAQSRPAPLQLGGAPLRPGLVQGMKIGANGADSGFVAKLPRTSAVGTASSGIEIDTLDFRPKWTMRLRLAGPDSMEIVIRCADTLPPQPRPYGIIILATGASHADPRYLAGELTVRENGVRRRFILGGSGDRITVAAAKDGVVAGAIAVVGRRIDFEAQGFPPWRYRGLEANFTTRRERPSAPAARLTPGSEVRMMHRALDGVLMTWYGAENGDGELADRSPAGVRSFVEQRWRPAIEVDSVLIQGDTLWLRLRGTRFRARCSRGGDEMRTSCTIPETRET